MTSTTGTLARRQPDSLADVLERVLDKGVVIAGDIVVNVLDIELLTLKLRLFVASAETAREMGMDWWTQDPFFSPGAAQVESSDHRALGDGDGDGADGDSQQSDDLRRQLSALRGRQSELQPGDSS